jgi:hypothetical protein
MPDIFVVYGLEPSPDNVCMDACLSPRQAKNLAPMVTVLASTFPIVYVPQAVHINKHCFWDDHQQMEERCLEMCSIDTAAGHRQSTVHEFTRPAMAVLTPALWIVASVSII